MIVLYYKWNYKGGGELYSKYSVFIFIFGDMKHDLTLFCEIHPLKSWVNGMSLMRKKEKKKKFHLIDCLLTKCSLKPENRFSLYSLQYAFQNARFQESSQLPNWQLNVICTDGLTLFETHGKERQKYLWKSRPASYIPLKLG